MASNGNSVATGVVFGMGEVLQGFETLKLSVRNKLTKRAIRPGMKIIGDEARRLAPVRYGHLKKAIVWSVDRKQKTKDTITGKVTISAQKFVAGVSKSGRPTWRRAKKGETLNVGEFQFPRAYAHLVEFGTRPHSLKKRGSKEEGEGAQHPGSTPSPFIRPAYQTKREAAVRAIRDAMMREINSEVLGISRRKGRKG